MRSDIIFHGNCNQDLSTDFGETETCNSNIVVWYGGPFFVDVRNVGGFVKLLINVRAPAHGDTADYEDKETHPDEEWIELYKFTQPSTFELPNLNPCAIKVVTG